MRLPAGQPTPEFVDQARRLLSAPRKPAAPLGSAAGDQSSEKSVAVLAFANLSQDPANEFFSDGISEEILNVVARIPGVSVVARTSAFFFKGKNATIPEIAKTLGVAHIVEGSVRKSGSRVRITAKLIGRHYDEALTMADSLRESHTRPAAPALDRHGVKPWTALP